METEGLHLSTEQVQLGQQQCEHPHLTVPPSALGGSPLEGT